MNHLESKFTGAGGLELFHQIWQADASPKAHIALVHGIGEHSGRYPNVAAHFPPRGYTVHGFDLRGHGRSPGRRGHINAWSEFREDVRAYIRMISAQAEGKPVFIYGHSLGGLIALEYVLHYPDLLQGVIASAPAVGQSAISPVLIFLSRVMSRVMPTFSLQTGLDATAVSRDPAVVNGYADPLVHSFASARFGTEAMAAQAWTNAHAPDLKLPLLIVTRPTLGTLNHTALTVEAACRRGLRLLGLVVNAARRIRADEATRRNPAALERLCRVPVLAQVPYRPSSRPFRLLADRLFPQE